MNTLPLFFNLTNKDVLIVGGGDVAYRKASLVMLARARVFVVAKSVDEKFFELLPSEQILQKSYDKEDLALANFAIIIVATDDNALNRQIYTDAHAKHIPVNVVDTPELCDFIFPAIVDRSPLVIGITSNGKAPVLARLVRAKIESMLPQNLSHIAKVAGEFRQTVKEKLPNMNLRRKFWEKIFADSLNETAVNPRLNNATTHGKQALTADDLAVALADFEQNLTGTHTGEVYIVGAGAGGADLLTFKALRLMQQADIVLYDALVPQEIVDLCRRDSDKIFVGKKRSNHTKTQDEINELLVFHAKAGKRVLRLKGGDPFIFGRGGEEMLACRQAGVPYQVVSGITSALAASNGAGIPLTHRGVATSVRFLTACYQSDEYLDELKSPYHKDETLVFYMGLHALAPLCQNLVKADVPQHTPVAIVSNAGRENQQVLTGTLDDIVAKQAVAQLPAPAVIIVGEVVALYGA